MTSMIPATGPVTGGVDTHGHTHHAAVLDHVGPSSVTESSQRRRLAIVRWASG